MQWFFLFFVISGFCSLVYQVAWLRMSMAGFGVTTTTVSIFLSIFMAGMALGSWGGGRLAQRFSTSTVTPLRFYAAAEAIIALSGVMVAPALNFAHQSSLGFSDSFGGYLVTIVLLSIILIPFCACMGATFPLAIAAARTFFTGRFSSAFSYLYVANVIGAMLGALLCAFVMIELFGFRGTIVIAAAMNMLVAVGAFLLSCKRTAVCAVCESLKTVSEAEHPASANGRLYPMLFLTGFASLAMEVVWTRLFMPVFGPVVYTFAFILAAYLLTTVVGSQYYRFRRKRGYELTDASLIIMLTACAVTSLFPLIVTDVRIAFGGGYFAGAFRMLAGLGPFCGLLGFLTPALLDRLSAGDPKKIGSGYALNMLGCIIGPVTAGFVLLPLIGEKWGLVALALPLLAAGYLFRGGVVIADGKHHYWQPISFAVLILILLLTRSPESFVTNGILKRDHTATVVAAGEGFGRLLLVNGYGMTSLTPITKMMVHLPMAFHDGPVNNGIVLCFGMGTSYRSMLTWEGTAASVVELVPSIPELIPFYHADGAAVLAATNGRIIIDDARRFLERTAEKFDVVVVDPPPPVEAVASSLLYSKEFYTVVKSRLAQGGIFQQWIPVASGGGTDDVFIISAMMKSVAQSFPFVRTFYSTGEHGIHILASMQPILIRSAEELASRLSQKSSVDLIEWGPHNSAADQFREVLSQEEPVEKFIAASPVSPALVDDRPVNEYFWLRRTYNK